MEVGKRAMDFKLRQKCVQPVAYTLALILLCAVPLAFLGGCTQRLQRYEATYLSLFDTVVTVLLYAESEAEAQQAMDAIYSDLARYDALFDIYETHDGVVNLKTVNDSAWKQPVAVEPELFSLLSFGKEVYDLTEGRVNIAFGSVLGLWHDARAEGIADPEHAALPERSALEAAAAHADIDDVILDAETGTVYLADPALRLDVGAIGKGFAAQLACDNARARGVTSLLLNLGGNVCALGPRADGNPWRIQVQDPDDPEAALATLELSDASLVTSGGYQRYYTVDGVSYHHIIDPDTLMPANYVKAVTVTHPDSGLADAFSTALFNLPYDEGRALAEANGVSAVWELLDGSVVWLRLDPTE